MAFGFGSQTGNDFLSLSLLAKAKQGRVGGRLTVSPLQRAQEKAAGLQNKALAQQLKIRRQLFDSLLGGGTFGASGSASGGGDSGALGLLDQHAAGQRQRINTEYDTLAKNIDATLFSRGLGVSNLVGVGAASAQEGRQQALLDLEDSIVGQKVGVRENAANRQLQILQSLLGIF